MSLSRIGIASWSEASWPLRRPASTRVVTSLSLLPPRFPELESPGLSKMLRTGAFAYPFLFDNLPLFYRVRGVGLLVRPSFSLSFRCPFQSWPLHLTSALLPTLQARHPAWLCAPSPPARFQTQVGPSPIPPAQPAFPLPAGTVLGQGPQLWARGAEHQSWLPPVVRAAHWFSLRLSPA